MKNIYILSYFLCLCSAAFGQLPSYAPTDSLVGFYSYSGNVLDNSGNGNNNANYNIVSTSDRFDVLLKAIYFSGSGSEYLDYGDVDDFEGGYQLSHSFWIMPEAFGGDAADELKPIISKWSAPSDLQGSSYMIAMNSTHLCLIYSEAVSSDTVFTSLSHFIPNEWSHVVVTFNYGLVKVYVDNVLVTDSGTSVSFLGDTDSGFKVGTWYSDVDPTYASFSGKIDDLGIWKRELDACEVEALYTGTACPTASLVEYSNSPKKVVRVTDFLGRGSFPSKLQEVKLIHYEDGTVEKVYTLID